MDSYMIVGILALLVLALVGVVALVGIRHLERFSVSPSIRPGPRNSPGAGVQGAPVYAMMPWGVVDSAGHAPGDSGPADTGMAAPEPPTNL